MLKLKRDYNLNDSLMINLWIITLSNWKATQANNRMVESNKNKNEGAISFGWLQKPTAKK